MVLRGMGEGSGVGEGGEGERHTAGSVLCPVCRNSLDGMGGAFLV